MMVHFQSLTEMTNISQLILIVKLSSYLTAEIISSSPSINNVLNSAIEQNLTDNIRHPANTRCGRQIKLPARFRI